MPDREMSILNLLKRAIFYAANGNVQIKNISFSKEAVQFLIKGFNTYQDYAETSAEYKKEIAYQVTNRMGFYLYDLVASFKNVNFINPRSEFLRKWNAFLYVDCITPGYLTGLSESEAKLVMGNTLSKEEQYDLYKYVLFNNPSTKALKEEIRNRVSAKATSTTGLMSSMTESAKSQHANPNDFRLS